MNENNYAPLPIQATITSKDEPMDEFEQTSNRISSKSNIIRSSKKIIFIAAGVFLCVAIIASGALLMSRPQVGNGNSLLPTATSIQSVTPEPTVARELPAEFKDLENKINTLQGRFDQTPTQRTQMNVPTMTIETNLQE